MGVPAQMGLVSCPPGGLSFLVGRKGPGGTHCRGGPI